MSRVEPEEYFPVRSDSSRLERRHDLTMFFVGMPLLVAQSPLTVKGKFFTTREQGHE
jgi:hypothetical protein